MATVSGDVVPGQWIVLMKPYVSDGGKEAHLASVKAMTDDEQNPFACSTHVEFDMPECRAYSAKFDLPTKEQIEKMDEVLSIEPVRYFEHCQRTTQDNCPWGLRRISQLGQVQPNGPYQYSYPSNATGVGTVAYIIDTGINESHIEFENRASRGPKFVTSATPTSDDDVLGHGTHVAGTVGSRAYGVAKSAKIISVKVFSDRTRLARTDDIILALNWIRNDAHGKKAVVNMSLGGAKSDALNLNVAGLVRSGIPVCVAAGNNAAIVDVFGPGTGVTSAWIGSNNANNTISGTSMGK
ncbi:Peptidase S8, subtilisin-related protein [Metarhizium guizhouense ARSEF 977]|uniref:Peptidase S8, subtilisin-related protein n=1 Tax=Metarhizium guizhouense (strain ARSEF 977) TaxID=1276136 RepID=A0A0B4G388_METGA|nr:Peptidase S8, subtilisin-related protein [Metarhizium guizhouense ARSEF 977]